MKTIESSDCVVVFLDVLGYSSWVNEVVTPEEFLNVFTKLLNSNEELKSKWYQALEFLGYVDFTIWSDSLIYVLNLEGLDEEKRKTVLSWFFYFISLTVVGFLADTGYFLRGGISHGNFLQKGILTEDNRFIFSTAYNEAVHLEKKADVPRILLNRKFIEGNSKFLDSWATKTIKHDIYNSYYLDYYSFLYVLPRGLAESYLKPIKEKLSSKFSKIENSERIRNKFLYFSNYHNQHVSNIFRAQLLEEDFELLKMNKMLVLLPLRDVGIVEDNNDFWIKKDVNSDLRLLTRALDYVFPSDDGSRAMLIAIKLKRRIEEANNKISEYEIKYS